MKYKCVVVKIGSSILAPQARLDRNLLRHVADQLNELLDNNINVCLVCSGAIVLGIQLLELAKRPSHLNKLQALASLGQTKLIDEFNRAMAKHDRFCGQILLTREDFAHRKRYVNAKHTFEELFKLKALPIVNENDTTSTEEIQFGDNDTLSALTAGLLEADLLIILSNIDGFLVEEKVVSEIKEINKDVLSQVREKTSAFTKGGMESKLKAIKQAAAVGTKVMLTNGREKDVITRIVFKNEQIGTLFCPGKKVTARKRWISQALMSEGRIVVDSGAMDALQKKGSSLLSKGVVAVVGDFAKYDAVCIESQLGKQIACGLSEYSSAYLKKNIGKKLAKEVIHRDNMVV